MRNLGHEIKCDPSGPKQNFDWMDRRGSNFDGLKCLTKSMPASIQLNQRVQAGQFKRTDGKTVDDLPMLPCTFVPHVDAIYSLRESELAWRVYGWLNIRPHLRPDNWLDQQQWFNQFTFCENFMYSPTFFSYIQHTKFF